VECDSHFGCGEGFTTVGCDILVECGCAPVTQTLIAQKKGSIYSVVHKLSPESFGSRRRKLCKQLLSRILYPRTRAFLSPSTYCIFLCRDQQSVNPSRLLTQSTYSDQIGVLFPRGFEPFKTASFFFFFVWSLPMPEASLSIQSPSLTGKNDEWKPNPTVHATNSYPFWLGGQFSSITLSNIRLVSFQPEVIMSYLYLWVALLQVWQPQWQPSVPIRLIWLKCKFWHGPASLDIKNLSIHE
jgi:hypothetical protein